MVKAAYQLFCSNGYLGTTIARWPTRPALRCRRSTTRSVPRPLCSPSPWARRSSASIGGGSPRPEPIDIVELLPWHEWWADFEAAPTSADALDIFITHGVGILQRVGPLVAAIHGASGDAEAAAVTATAEERRVDTYREAVRVIAGKPGGLRRGLSLTRATDIVVVLFSAELYQALAVGRGWSHPQCVDFFRQTLTAQLL